MTSQASFKKKPPWQGLWRRFSLYLASDLYIGSPIDHRQPKQFIFFNLRISRPERGTKAKSVVIFEKMSISNLINMQQFVVIIRRLLRWLTALICTFLLKIRHVFVRASLFSLKGDIFKWETEECHRIFLFIHASILFFGYETDEQCNA